MTFQDSSSKGSRLICAHLYIVRFQKRTSPHIVPGHLHADELRPEGTCNEREHTTFEGSVFYNAKIVSRKGEMCYNLESVRTLKCYIACGGSARKRRICSGAPVRSLDVQRVSIRKEQIAGGGEMLLTLFVQREAGKTAK